MFELISLFNEWKYARLSLGITFGLGVLLMQFPPGTVAFKIGYGLNALAGTLGAGSAGPSKEKPALDQLKAKLGG